jgi:DNA replication and repair protein RecF
MRVRELRLSNFRNYAHLELRLGEHLNIFHGENAQGKTNLLEAIALLATTRSFRASREAEMVRQGEEVATVAAEVDREREVEVALQMTIFQSDKKSIHVNGLRRPRVVDLLGEFNVVSFGSIDIAIVSGEPSARRHYLNMEISQISPGYVHSLAHYKRVLEQRNRLLRDLRERPRSPGDAGLDAWNAQLIRHGAPLIEKRRFFINRLAPLADEIHRNLTDGKEGLDVRYLPSVQLSEIAETSGTEEIAETFTTQLQGCFEDEARRGTTLLGPQRDDISFSINGFDARTYGSQGQQRTVTLAIKLAEYRLFEQHVGEAPVLLLDDVLSDLDDARRQHLLDWIQHRGQTVISCTNLRSFSSEILSDASTFFVSAGTVTPDEPTAPEA